MVKFSNEGDLFLHMDLSQPILSKGYHVFVKNSKIKEDQIK